MSRQPRLFEPEVPIPEELRPAVELWLKHKAERREPYKPTGLAMLLERMAELGAGRAMAAVRHSIANNWSGLFEPRGELQNRQGDPPDDVREFLPPSTVASWLWLSKEEQRLAIENGRSCDSYRRAIAEREWASLTDEERAAKEKETEEMAAAWEARYGGSAN